jgi:hypothetical protein
MPEQVHERRAPSHVTADPGIGKDHDADPACWCHPSRLFPLNRTHAPVFVHRGAASRITRLTERSGQ